MRHFDSSFPLTKFRPPKDIQTESDGRRIKSVDVAAKFENMVYSLCSSYAYHIVCKLLEDFAVSILIGFCKVTSSDTFAETQVVRFTSMGSCGGDEIS